MKKDELIKQVAKLESINDQLGAELKHLDDLLRKIGFEYGIKTLKQAAYEIINKNNLKNPPENN
ncbi:MAG: hypothetical protein A3F40_03340 [Chlamydiae bacterium RIFCSPHIGHO2_12_FULL_27_8]|nr:MAG: hypothetical protein A3F40_03340 [Chlamydiae bacterium RIFCSPHIGHO2_12_FULL_27_8]OGN65914.1 MAG: hypothetical protein A2888_01015 [Chlamydiae bacterium RIFCSPLOWO2_01_FULL_28_7]